MKYKALIMILLAAMLVTPVFAFVHPPPPPPPDVPCPTFGVKINGDWAYDISEPYLFVEPEDSFCTEFTVEVWALNMTDLYGFEFTLVWGPSGYFNLLSWVVEDVWPSQLLVVNTTDYLSWFQLAVVAMAPSAGVNGDVLLATLTFHIFNDVCWPQGSVEGSFYLIELKASDSCTTPIKLCDPIPAYWEFIAKEPEVYITPKEDINCVVGEMVTYSVWVHNITKMKSLYFDLRWMGNHIVNCKEDLWQLILNLTVADVVINESIFPEANRTSSISISHWGADSAQYSNVVVDIVMDPGFPLINGTFKAVDLTFEKMDPWYCGRMPNYTLVPPHSMIPLNASTPIWFYRGWIDVCCPWLRYIDFGDNPLMTDPHGYWFASYNEAKFTFMPVPGDLTGDGVVDILDLTTIAGKYGLDWKCWYSLPDFSKAFYYDFNKDGIIDIFDIIVVSKNFGAECPF